MGGHGGSWCIAAYHAPGIEAELQKDNLVLEALRMFSRRVNRKVGVRVWLFKHIPVASGLGGGSSDAACMLRILNHAFGEPLAQEELAELAVLVGADVPFSLTLDVG